MQRMTDKSILAKHHAATWGSPYCSVGSLRYAGRMAYLDGRTAMAKEWNRRAARLGKLRPDVVAFG